MRWRQPCTRSSVRLSCKMMRGLCELSVRNTHGCNSTPWWLSSLKKARANWGCSIISFVGGSESKSISRGAFSFVSLHVTCTRMSESLLNHCEILNMAICVKLCFVWIMGCCTLLKLVAFFFHSPGCWISFVPPCFIWSLIKYWSLWSLDWLSPLVVSFLWMSVCSVYKILTSFGANRVQLHRGNFTCKHTCTRSL